MQSLRYLIVAPTFDDASGGAIALHFLCHLLNESGQEAALVPFGLLPLRTPGGPKSPIWFTEFAVRRLLRKEGHYSTNPAWRTPVSLSPSTKDAVVIYPEVIPGNPLRASRVVRWYLHKPGFHGGDTKFGQHELSFYYQGAFGGSAIHPGGKNILHLVWHREDIYKRRNYGSRSGTCYMLRKGANRTIVHDTSQSLLVDGLSHTELARVFNEKECFISYDPYTLYTTFAAMCGCRSIVVPMEGISKSQWGAESTLRLGVAYGFDDIDWAIQSQPDLIPAIKGAIAEQSIQLDRFVAMTQRQWGS